MNRKCKVIPFENKNIRVMMDRADHVFRVCLYDLCGALRREDMIPNGKAEKLCPSALMMNTGEGKAELLFIIPFEITRLTRSVREDSRIAANLCDRLDEWVAKLKVGSDPGIKLIIQQPKRSEHRVLPATLDYNGNPMSFKDENGIIYFNATQMARSFDKLPSDWLRLADTIRLREALVNNGKYNDIDIQIKTSRGSSGATWMVDELALEFARWLSPPFAVWCNDALKKLLTQGNVSLDEMKNDTRKEIDSPVIIQTPQTLREALLLAAEQQRIIEENRHKVEYYNDVIENREYFRSRTIADELNITPYKLHQFLSENDICFYYKGQWIVKSPYRTLQAEIPYYWFNKKTGKSNRYGFYRYWTQAGREFIIELWKQQNPELQG